MPDSQSVSQAKEKVEAFLRAVRIRVGKEQLPEILSKRATRVEKADLSYVTQGDLMVQEIVLNLASQHLEDLFIVSEELVNTGDEPLPGSIVIVIDPIDGTENFTSGLAEWGISISCYRNGTHISSLIGCPELNLWIQTGERFPRFQSRIRGLSSSLTKEQILSATEGFEYRILGCCVYNMMAVVRGSFLSFENPKGANSWDILAGLNLALEQGLSATVNDHPYAGEYLPPTQKYRFKVENR